MTQIKSQLRPTSLNVNILKRRPHDCCVNGKNMLIAENRPELQRNFNWLESVKTRPTGKKNCDSSANGILWENKYFRKIV